VRVADQAEAGKLRLGEADAVKLAEAACNVVVSKGQKVVRFDMKTDPPDRETLLKHLLGPTGRLRAPAIRAGTTLLVGFNDEAYTSALT
jgi:hypothetical protein